MFGGTHSMSMPVMKAPARSFATLSAEDENIAALRSSIISRRGLVEEGALSPAPRKFVRSGSSPHLKVDFDEMCTRPGEDRQSPASRTIDCSESAPNEEGIFRFDMIADLSVSSVQDLRVDEREDCSPHDVSKMASDAAFPVCQPTSKPFTRPPLSSVMRSFSSPSKQTAGRGSNSAFSSSMSALHMKKVRRGRDQFARRAKSSPLTLWRAGLPRGQVRRRPWPGAGSP